jgi:outer membrane immunogenic protein
MSRTVLGASVAVVCISSIASADPPPKKVAPVYVPPSYSWTGCYIGANAGGAWQKVHNTLTATNGTPAYFGVAVLPDVSRNGTDSLESGGFIGGGQVGCNYQSGVVVWGLETDFDWMHQHAHSGGRFVYSTDPTSPYFLDVSDDKKWLWTARGRIGVTATDRLLLYVTGGFAALRMDFRQTFSEPPFTSLRMERRRSRRSPRPKAGGRLAPA